MAQTKNTDEFLKAKDVAEMLHLSKGYIYALTCKKQIPHYKIAGSGVLFKRSEIMEWVERGKVEVWK